MAPSAALAINRQTPVRLQPRGQYVRENRQDVTGQVVRPFAVQRKARDHKLSDEQSSRTIGKRVADALRRRVGQGKAITIKQLAYSIHISEQTLWNLLSGNSDPSGRVLMGLLTFFDSAFANEILEPTGCTVAKLGDARAEALAKVAEGMEALRRLG